MPTENTTVIKQQEYTPCFFLPLEYKFYLTRLLTKVRKNYNATKQDFMKLV